MTAPAVPLRFPEGKLDPELLRLQQEAADTQERMRLGGVFYPLGWIFVVLTGGPHGAVAWAVGLVLLALAGLRFAFPISAQVLADRRTLRQRIRWPWAMIYAACLVWGLACAWVLSKPEFDASRTMVLFGCVAFATASAHGFAMRRHYAIGTLVLLLLPPILTLGLLRHQVTLAWMILVYAAYAGLALERSHREWMKRLELDLELRRQRDQFARLSRRDGLTGLANRLYFDHALREAVSSSHATRAPLSLLLCDIDKFKSVNDRHGHAQGDACLIAFAQRLQREFAASETLVARVGGEEFAVLLPGVALDEATARAEAFRTATAKEPMRTPQQDLPITVSIGVAAASASNGEADSVERLYKAADAGLYRAKSEGRDCVRVAA